MKSVKSLYKWMMKKSKHPKSVHFLCVFSFIESIFFPIPVDPFLMALSLARPKRALFFGLLTTFFSIFGALAGYLIGAFFWSFFEGFVTSFIFSGEQLDVVFHQIQKNGFWTLFLSALTPLPFKVFAVASGVFKLNVFVFLIASFLGRGFRFLSLSLLFYIYGASIHSFVERYFEKILVFIAFFVILCAFFFFLL